MQASYDGYKAFLQKSGVMYCGWDGKNRLVDLPDQKPIATFKTCPVAISRDGGAQVGSTYDNSGLGDVWLSSSSTQLPEKDAFETSAEYLRRLSDWVSPFSTAVELLSYDADAAVFQATVFGDATKIPVARDEARVFAGKSSALLTGLAKVHDGSRLVVEGWKLERLPE